MLARIVLLAQIASIIASAGFTANPRFVCDDNNRSRTTDHNWHSYNYNVTWRNCDEIVVQNCDATVTAQILTRIANTSELQSRPILLQSLSPVASLGTLRPEPATAAAPIRFFLNISISMSISNLDLSRNELTAVDLQRLESLRTLNLTANRVSTLRSIKVSPRATVLQSLDVTRNRLFEFEQLVIPPTERLYLRANNIVRLDANITLPPWLKLLDLTRNEIENVYSVAFRSANLTELNLSVNLIKAVSARTFENLPALRTLNLECNKIGRIESTAFAANRKLIELNLRDNNLSSLTKGVLDRLANLQVLDVSKNNLVELSPDALLNLDNLIVFSVSENVNLCDSQCGQQRRFEFLLVLGGRLRVLRMDRLRLRQFPVILTTSVQRLYVRENRLRAIRQGDLDNFPLLQTLAAGGNEIATIENDVFSRMEFLRELRLDDNRLASVPTTLPRSLETLHLHRNRIRRLEPNDFVALYALRQLKLDSNAIRSIESGTFGSLRRLETLDISANPIFTLSADALHGPTQLQRLFASDLPLAAIFNVTTASSNSTPGYPYPYPYPNSSSYCPICPTTRYLRQLDLSGSARLVESFLANLPFLNVTRLELLDLSRSNVKRLPPFRIDLKLPRLIRLNASGNPLDCQVTGRWWNEWRPSIAATTVDLGHSLAVDRRSPPPHHGLQIRVHPNETIDDDFVVVDGRCRRHDGVSTQKIETVLKGDEFWSRFDAVGQSTPPKNVGRFRQSMSNDSVQYTSRMAVSSTRRHYHRRKHETITADPSDLWSRNVSFFDWFPATAATGTLDDWRGEEAAAALDDRHVEYTHPGLVIFEVVVCFLLVLLVSMVVPPCLRKYRYNGRRGRRRRHPRRKMSRIDDDDDDDDDECRPSFEISSVSAFVENEIIVE